MYLHFYKTLAFTHFNKRIYLYYWHTNTMTVFFIHSVFVKACISFVTIRLYFSFELFFHYTVDRYQILSVLCCSFYPILYCMLSENFHPQSKKTISFSKTLCILTCFWKHYTLWLNFLIILVTNKVFKTFFTKRNLLTYHYFVNIYIPYNNWMLRIVKFMFFNLIINK